MKKILFVLPQLSKYPIGGYKIVYEYANALVNKYEISIVHVTQFDGAEYNHVSWLRKMYVAFLWNFNLWKWFNLNPKINVCVRNVLTNELLNKYDAVIVTFWASARVVSQFKYDKEKVIYFIQGYEVWAGKKEIIDATFLYGFKNVVITSWLKNKLCSLGADTYKIINNGIPTKNFYLVNPIVGRNGTSMCMMYHEHPWKGSKDALKAIKRVKKKYPALHVVVFSVYKKNKIIPNWCEFIYRPSVEMLRLIYNNASIFISTSWSEGFGLTGPEAMACGCALVTTDNGGSQDYAFNNITALVSKPKDIDELEYNLLRMIENKSVRENIARNGEEYTRKYLDSRVAEKKFVNMIDKYFCSLMKN